MSNNKQTMKLYTEEQIKNAYTQIWCDGGHDKYSLSGLEEMLEQLTPIELPSDSLCINCDESKSTHNVCMDCMIKIGKENIELPSDEEIAHLQWIYDRMSNVHDENENYDYMLKFKEIIEQLKKGGNNEQQ